MTIVMAVSLEETWNPEESAMNCKTMAQASERVSLASLIVPFLRR